MSHVALTKCFFCGEDNDILLHRSLKDISECHGKVVHMNPCSKCAELMQQGVLLITIDDEKSDRDWNIPPTDKKEARNWMPNPYRTGGFFVIRDEAIQRILDSQMASFATEHRWMFIEHAAAEAIGLFDSVSD